MVPAGPAPPPAPRASRAPRADARAPGCAAPGATRARGPGRGARARASSPPVLLPPPIQVPVRALSEALYSFFDRLMLIPRPDCAPLAPPPSWRAHHSLFGPRRGPSQGFQLSFCCFIFPPPCFSRHFPPEKLVPARGPPPVTVVPLPP